MSKFSRKMLFLAQVAALFLLPCNLRAGEPRATFVFNTEERHLTAAGGETAEIEVKDSLPWVDSEEGPVVALGGDHDMIRFSSRSFALPTGGVRLRLRPDEATEKSQYLFRIYHGKGDGLTLFLKDGMLFLRYHNRASGESVGTRLPEKVVPMGMWATLDLSWDFGAGRKLTLLVNGKQKVVVKLREDLVLTLHDESDVVVGNEHAGKAPFHGVIQKVEFFDGEIEAPLVEHPQASRIKADVPHAKRERVLPNTLFFSRSQPKYDLHTNTLLRRWIDRPLFFDRRTVESTKPYVIVSSASFFKEQESVAAYGLDGFGSLLASQPFQGTAFLEMLDYAESGEGRSVPLVMEVGETADEEALANRLELFVPLAKRAVRSSHVLKINGKVLVLSYAIDAAPVSIWKRFCDEVRTQAGGEFLFIADVTAWRPRLLKEFHELGGGISQETLELFRQHLRSWLDASDGLMWAGGSHTNRPDGTFSREFYKEFLLPVLAGIFNEPAYKGKLLGLDGEVGYINVMTSRRSNWEEGTSRLRDILALVQEVNPDFVTMPEWNELNENTSVAPTLTNSLTTQHIVRFMKRQAGGDVPELPLAADVPPNVLLSFRPYLKLGEKAVFEVLHIPDSQIEGEVKVELALRGGASGEIVKRFPSVAFAAGTMEEHRFEIATEELASHPFLSPVLKVTAADGRVSLWEEGLESLRLLPTWNLNGKETKISIRDLLQPTRVDFSVVNEGGQVKVKGHIECDEEIASVEIVQNARELYAVGAEEELLPREGEMLVLLHWQAMRNPRNFHGEIGIDGGGWRKFRQWSRPEYKREEYRLFEEGGNRVRFVTAGSVNATNARGGFFVVPNWKDATLWIKTEAHFASFPLAQVAAEGAMATVLPGGVTIEAHRLQTLPEVPFPLLKKEASFETVVHPQGEEAPLQMRVVTTSGKIYRSRLHPLKTDSPQNVPLEVWSHSQGKPVSLSLPLSRLADVEARFSPSMGGFIRAEAGANLFRGYVGGVPFDMGAFAKRHLATAYPASSSRTAPTWEKVDGRDILRFNGKGNFLYFPDETVPRGSFTLEFEIRPTTTERPVVLCTQRGYSRGALSLRLVKGEITAEWLNGQGESKTIRTGLFVPEQEWSQVVVRHDFHTLRFTVNGQHYEEPVQGGVPSIVTPFIFGGYGTGKGVGYFEGELRSLRIKHYASVL